MLVYNDYEQLLYESHHRLFNRAYLLCSNLYFLCPLEDTQFLSLVRVSTPDCGYESQELISMWLTNYYCTDKEFFNTDCLKALNIFSFLYPLRKTFFRFDHRKLFFFFFEKANISASISRTFVDFLGTARSIKMIPFASRKACSPAGPVKKFFCICFFNYFSCQNSIFMYDYRLLRIWSIWIS